MQELEDLVPKTICRDRATKNMTVRCFFFEFITIKENCALVGINSLILDIVLKIKE